MMTMYDPPVPKQLITLQGTDAANSYSVYGREVEIVCSVPSLTEKTTTGSNKVKTTPVVKYEWESMHYIGNLVAVHRNNIYAAYSLRGKSGGIVRIVNRKTAERALLKDLVGRVVDVAFAHTDDIIIAAVDEIGNLFVHEIHEADDKKLTYPCQQNMNFHIGVNESAEIWNIDMVKIGHGTNTLSEDEAEYGLIRIQNHNQAIVDAAFSPDGTALATASLDGEVKFFQVNMNDNASPRCLHQWKPHDGKQLSCLFFLDDHRNSNSESQFWKFAVTGACNNQELRVWSCESWTCLQTLRFQCPSNLPMNFTSDPCMKAAMDLSASYLILSDIKRQVLYVLQIHQDGASNAAHVSSVSEFMLASPCLSFSILDASKKKFKKSLEDSHLDEITTGELDREETEETQEKSENQEASGIQLRLYTVHPKALQELLIRFRPESSAPSAPTPSISTISHDETGLRDALSDMSLSMDVSVADSEDVSRHQDPPQPVLLTPDAFTSPRKQQGATSVDQPVRASGSSTSSFTQVTGLNDELLSPHSSGNQSALSDTSTITHTPKDKVLASTFHDEGESITPLVEVDDAQQDVLNVSSQSKKSDSPPRGQERLNNVSLETFENVDESFTKTIDSAASVTMATGSGERSKDSTYRTTGFEVDPLSTSQNLQSTTHKDSYDENDEEVAEVLGEKYEQEEIPEVIDTKSPEGMEFSQPDFSQPEEEEERVTEGRSWPSPPQVAPETKRIQGEVSQRMDFMDEDVDDDDVDVRVEAEEDVDNQGSQERESELEEGDSGPQASKDQSSEEEEKPGRSQAAPVAAPIKEMAPIKEIHYKEVVETVDKEALRKLTESVQTLMTAMEAQNSRIEQLQYQLSEYQERQVEMHQQKLEREELHKMAHEAQPNIEEQLDKLESIVTSRVERMFAQHAQKEKGQRTQQLLKHTEGRERDQQEKLKQTVIQTINSAVASNVERQVRQEMRNVVLPNVTRILEPLKDQLHHELAQKLTATDSLLKDNIGKMVRSKQTIDTLAQSVCSVLQTPIQAAYREAFHNIVIPSFERATHNLFAQVNDTFVKGAKETIKHLDAHLEDIRQKHVDARDPIIGQLRKLTDTFQASAENIQKQVISTIHGQIKNEMQQSTNNLEDIVMQCVRQVVKEEVGVAVREQGATISDSVLNAMRSGAMTPVQMSPDPQHAQSQVLQLLRQGQLNAAFQQALSAANLDLVVFVCETVNPSQVFNQSPCPLQQPVLLSLIQQLSADIGNNTELKHKYLEEAVMNLDTGNPVTREHMKSVLFGLIQKLKAYIPSHPNDKTTRSLKMLQMASESLLK
ncbi:hypothetical protein FSP39_008550 [Pinctada imbricata]|uniref:Enhancer of mRNA-decapping protein 4 WD40 repeat region domain-containing protein n=1 Tax=Pinctada imbricata TaxID=66713 RepID=A0AA88XYQ4_PINIB|nr:hypothetical protein FSP39_008550 [Pinctada imbricata]